MQSQIHTERKIHHIETSESKENLDPITYRKEKASSVNENQIKTIMESLQKQFDYKLLKIEHEYKEKLGIERKQNKQLNKT